MIRPTTRWLCLHEYAKRKCISGEEESIESENVFQESRESRGIDQCS